MTTMIVREAVADAAKVLDEAYPGWEEKIDQRSLDISEPASCIAGQLHSKDWGESTRWLQKDLEIDSHTFEYAFSSGTANESWMDEINTRLSNRDSGPVA